MACDSRTLDNPGSNYVHQSIAVLSDLSKKVQEQPPTFVKPSIQASSF